MTDCARSRIICPWRDLKAQEAQLKQSVFLAFLVLGDCPARFTDRGMPFRYYMDNAKFLADP